MNNVSFLFPSKMSLLEAHSKGASGVYTSDFPDAPPMTFDYNNATAVSMNSLLLWTTKATKLRKLKYNTTVEVVLQNTALIRSETQPIHLHGFNFFVVAQGCGTYNTATAVPSYNLVNPQERNTIAVLPGGWAVIRFRANNPGVWFFNSNLERNLPIGWLCRPSKQWRMAMQARQAMAGYAGAGEEAADDCHARRVGWASSLSSVLKDVAASGAS